MNVHEWGVAKYFKGASHDLTCFMGIIPAFIWRY
jgi:hypothetical protein